MANQNKDEWVDVDPTQEDWVDVDISEKTISKQPVDYEKQQPDLGFSATSISQAPSPMQSFLNYLKGGIGYPVKRFVEEAISVPTQFAKGYIFGWEQHLPGVKEKLQPTFTQEDIKRIGSGGIEQFQDFLKAAGKTAELGGLVSSPINKIIPWGAQTVLGRFGAGAMAGGLYAPEKLESPLQIGLEQLGKAGLGGIIFAIGQPIITGISQRLTTYFSPAFSETVDISTNRALLGQELKGLKEIFKVNLPKKMTARWVTDIGKTFKSSIEKPIEETQSLYKQTLSPFYSKDLSAETNVILKKVPKSIRKYLEIDLEKSKTLGETWTTRNNLLEKIGEIDWTKSEYFQRVGFGKKQLMGIVGDLKKLVLDNTDDATRLAIEKLDPAYTELMHKGRMFIRKIYDAKGDTYRTEAMINIFKNPENSGLQTSFNDLIKYNSILGQVRKDIQKYIARRVLKETGKRLIGRGVQTAIGYNLLKGSLKQ